MKIGMNAIGNYNPYQLRDVQATAKTVKSVPLNEEITKEEKAFFTEMYPVGKTEINDYHFYARSGKMTGVSVGSLLDRRG